MNTFKHATYIVVDLPEEIAKQVMAVRISHQDEFRASLPVEITVVGSSGVGVISEGQDESEVYRIVQKIAQNTEPFKLSFDHVVRFPGTDIFVLKLTDETEMRNLHNKFISSEIKFENSNFEYGPHCTLRSRSPITEEDEQKIYDVKIEGEFLVDTLSVYMLDALPIKKLFTVKLGGKSGS